MKTRSCISGIKHFIARILIILCGMVMVSDSWAQQPGVAVSDNKVTITIKRAAPLQETTEMLKAFNLTKLPLAQWIAGRQLEQTSQYGWTLQRFDSKWLILSRTVDELSDFKEAEEKMLAAGLHYSGDDLFPENFRSPAFAYNKLRQSWAVSIQKKSGDAIGGRI